LLVREVSDHQGIGAWQVAVFAFSMSCAGPFGVEDCVRTAGVVWTCVGLLASSVLSVLPQIYMTAELSMITPLSNGGIISWAARAFGRTASMFAALNMLVYQVVDLATYATLCAGYADSGGFSADLEMAKWAPFLVIAIGFVFNLLNLELACTLYAWLLAFVLLPIGIGVLCGLPHVGTAWAEIAGETKLPSKGDLNLFMSTLFWLSTGWDSMGNLASRVESPQAMLRGLVGTACFVPLLYVVCIVVAAGAGPGSWEDGYLAVAFGSYLACLRPWICFCAALSTILMYMSELTTVGFLVQSMGDPQDELRLLPAWFGASTRSGAPANALLAVTILQGCLASLTFGYLVQLSTLLHVLAFWMELASYVRLKQLQSHRLWEVPFGKTGAGLVVLTQVPVLTCLLAAALLDPAVVMGAIGANAFVALLLFLRHTCGH